LVKIIYPIILASVTKKKEEEIEFSGSIQSLLDYLCEKYKKIEKVFYNEEGFNRFINIYVNNEDIRNLNGFETEVKDDDVVKFIPAIAGG
jgi:MoaD family protein